MRTHDPDAPTLPESPGVPVLFQRLIDDAAVFPPGSARVAEAVAAHHAHLDTGYARLVGPLLLPVSVLDRVPDPHVPRLAVVGDTGLASLGAALEATARLSGVSQFEIAVAKRGEDPRPGLRALLTEAAQGPELDVYAEIPLTWGLLEALDTIADARVGGARVAPKFRTGGLAAELFPTPMELAAVVCACRDRDLPFKLTAGLDRALRHTDPETGFTHHGFLNLLSATLAAAEGAEVADVADLLGATDPVLVIETVRTRRDQQRPLWVGFGSCSIAEPLADLVSIRLCEAGAQP